MKTTHAFILYSSLWTLYLAQGILYDKGGIVSHLLLVLTLLMSIYYAVVVNKTRKRPLFIKALNALIVMFTIYGLVYMASGNVYFLHFSSEPWAQYKYLQNVYMSMLPIYAFYYFAKKGAIGERWINYWILFFVIRTIITFFMKQEELLMDALDNGENSEEFTNNVGYSFVSLIPLLYLWKGKTWMQNTLLGICTIFIFLSIKRGAILIGSLMIAYFLYEKINSTKGRSRYAIIGITTLIVIAIGVYVVQFISTSDYFQSRIEETLNGNTSGRDELVLPLLHHFYYETTAAQILFGNGADSTIGIAGNFAHNDWIEILTCNGLVGVMIFLFFFIALAMAVMKSHKIRHNDYSVALALTTFKLFASTLFSMSYSSISLALSLCLGLCIADLYMGNKKPTTKTIAQQQKEITTSDTIS